MAESLIINTVLQDDASPTLEKFKSNLKTFQKEITQTSSGMEIFGKSLTDNFVNKIPGVGSSLGMMEKALGLVKNPLVQLPIAAGAAMTAMIAFSNSNTNAVHELVLMSEKTSISVNALKALKKVGTESGVGFEQLSNATVKLEKNIGTNSAALAKLGITSHDPTEAMAQLADKISATKDPMEKARIGSAALGKSYADMLPLLNQGGEAIRNAANASSISDTMIARYEKIHKDQIAITSSAGAWKTALGDIATVALGPIYDKLASIAKQAKDVSIYFSKIGQDKVAEQQTDAILAKAEKAKELVKSQGNKSGTFQGALSDINNTNDAKQSAYVKSITDSFKGLSVTAQEEIYEKIIDKIPEQFRQKTLAAIAEIKKATIKDENSGKKSGGSDEGQKDNSKSLALAEELFKEKGKLEIASIHDSEEREKKSAEVEYNDKVHNAEKTFNEIKSKTKKDQENLVELKKIYAQEYTEKIIDIETKAQEEITKKHKEELDKRIKAQEEATKKAEEILKLSEEAYLSSITDENEKELVQLDMKYQDELKQHQENAQAKHLIDIRYENERLHLIDKQNKKAKADTEKSYQQVSKYMESCLTSPLKSFGKTMLTSNQSAKMSFKTLGNDMYSALIDSCEDMVVAYLSKKAFMYASDSGLFKAFNATNQATSNAAQAQSVTSATATSAQIETATAPAAATASAATWGGAAAAGAAAMLALLALVKSFDVGTTNVSSDQLAQIHKGEVIIPARQSAEMRKGNYGPAMQFMGHSQNTTSAQPQITINANGASAREVSRHVTKSLKEIETINTRARR